MKRDIHVKFNIVGCFFTLTSKTKYKINLNCFENVTDCLIGLFGLFACRPRQKRDRRP